MEIEKNYRPPRFNKHKLRSWQPKTWQPEYEKIVSESILTGISNVKLAEKYGFTVVHISNILNTEEARKLKSEAVDTIRKNSKSILENQITRIQTAALENIAVVLEDKDDKLITNSPFALLDKSIQALKGIGVFKGEGGGVTVNTNTNNIDKALINLGEEQQKTFLEGLDKANEALLLHRGVTGESIK